MKKLFVVFLLFFSTFLFAGKYLSINQEPNSDLVRIIVDLPESVSDEQRDGFIQELKEMGFKNIYIANDKLSKKENVFTVYFKLFGSKNNNKILDKIFDLPPNYVLSRTKVVFSSCYESGNNLSGIIRVKNGMILFTSDINEFYTMITLNYKSSQFSAMIFNSGKFSSYTLYDNDYSFINCEIPFYFAMKDYEYFYKTLVDIHPCLLNDKELLEFIDFQVNSYGELSKYSKDGYVRIKDLLRLLYKTAAYFNDGHISIWKWYYATNENSKGCGFLPMFLAHQDGNFYIEEVIKEKVPERFKGARILTLNGKNPWDFFKPILDMCSAEGRIFKAERFIESQPFFYSLSEMLKLNQKVSVKTDKGEFEVSCVDADTFQKLAKTITRIQKGIQFKFYENGKIAYFYLPEFKYSNEYLVKINNFFEQVFEKKSKAIIIDIRDNGGGNSLLGDYIVAHFTDKPFNQYSAVESKYSTFVLKNYFPYFAGRFDLKGIMEFSLSKPEKVMKVKKIYGGKVFVLINGKVFSSATDFATVMKDYKLATLIGYETGGWPTSYGDVLPMKLPFLGIWYAVSWKKFYRAKYSPETANRGLLPDISLNDEKLKPFQKEKDPFLAFALNYVKKEIK